MPNYTTNLAEAEYAQAQPEPSSGIGCLLVLALAIAMFGVFGALCFEIGRRAA